MQHKAVIVVLKLGVARQDLLRHEPKLAVEAVKHVVALNTDFFDDVLVKVIQQLLARVLLPLGDVGLQFLLQLIEFEDDLLR